MRFEKWRSKDTQCFIYLINQYICPDNRLSVTQFRESGIGTKGKEFRSLFKCI